MRSTSAPVRISAPSHEPPRPAPGPTPRGPLDVHGRPRAVAPLGGLQGRFAVVPADQRAGERPRDPAPAHRAQDLGSNHSGEVGHRHRPQRSRRCASARPSPRKPAPTRRDTRLGRAGYVHVGRGERERGTRRRRTRPVSRVALKRPRRDPVDVGGGRSGCPTGRTLSRREGGRRSAPPPPHSRGGRASFSATEARNGRGWATVDALSRGGTPRSQRRPHHVALEDEQRPLLAKGRRHERPLAAPDDPTSRLTHRPASSP
jgi:hypothetical protein